MMWNPLNPLGPLARWPVGPFGPNRQNRLNGLNGPNGQNRLNGHGQSILEAGVLIAVVGAALVAMGIYLRRGYQGYIRETSQTHGSQFNPTRPFDETHRLNNYTRSQIVDITSGEASVPVLGGALPGRLLTTKVVTATDWDLTRDTRHEAQ